ncbi:18024_t:CDS:1, partial [Gigaspora rosea]
LTPNFKSLILRICYLPRFPCLAFCITDAKNALKIIERWTIFTFLMMERKA